MSKDTHSGGGNVWQSLLHVQLLVISICSHVETDKTVS
jgi:hypothetical protein